MSAARSLVNIQIDTLCIDEIYDEGMLTVILESIEKIEDVYTREQLLVNLVKKLETMIRGADDARRY